MTFTKEERIKELDHAINEQEQQIEACQRQLNYSIPRLIELIKIRSKL